MQTKHFETDGLEYLVVEPVGYQKNKAYPLIIMLHGYLSYMGDLATLAESISPNRYLYAFPNAPIPVPMGTQTLGYAWSNPPESDFDPAGTTEQLLDKFLEDLISRYTVSEGRLVLGGFSQGGMMAFRHGLSRPDIFCGLICLSTRIPEFQHTVIRLPTKRDQRIFLAHGSHDTVIPLSEGLKAREFLVSYGFSPDYHEYNIAHEITTEVIYDLRLWLNETLGETELKDPDS